MPYKIVYSSQATVPMRLDDLEAILVDARAGNEARHVTGALIYVDGVFLQILEGEEATVRALMRSIAADSRHSAVTVFQEGEVAERSFADWRMAYLQASPDQLLAWAGLHGTTTVESILRNLGDDPGRVSRVVRGILATLAA
jgi:hypothetical protein